MSSTHRLPGATPRVPYDGEYATGHTLARLVDNPAVRDFDGEIKKSTSTDTEALPDTIAPPRGSTRVKRLIAIDGSTVTSRVENGHPGAEASLLNIAAVVIALAKLRQLAQMGRSAAEPIPSPADVRKLEAWNTLSAVLPGRNVIGKSDGAETPKRFFRQVVHREISGATLSGDHETLLETLRDITNDRATPIQCPGDSCDQHVTPQSEPTKCGACGEIVYPSDSLRCHERFEDYGSSEQAFTMVRIVVEHLSLVNLIRWFERHDRFDVLDGIGFIMDGPLAIFGMAAWLKKHIQDELARLHQLSLDKGGAGVLLVGVEKHGMFMDHLEALDWSAASGERGRLEPGTVMAPDIGYIHQHIALRPPDAKPHGEDTYYGRHLMYKSLSGQHAALTLPIVNVQGADPACVDEEAFPRVGDALDLIDELGTHLYKDGFAPLARAHLHAAVPLHRGTEILASIFSDR
ncbi:MAG: hypothetical protein F4Y28_06110 [Acidimicrobiia bacterium]|nr:hypothetical protein [Acidimicrobiia bacterium]MYG58820.1 hypothetical protein [Acidimicrobiia bacterium]MYJ33544.1 hypothetical protein [Acidimicrobiia bacterium]